MIQKLLLNIIPPSFIYFFFRSSLWNLTVMRNIWAELPPRPTRAESKSPRLFWPGKAQKREKPQEIERTFPQGFSRYHSRQSAWLWWEEICVIQNNNKLHLEPSLKEKGTIVKKKSWKIIHQNLYLFSSYSTVFEICNTKYKRGTDWLS